MGRASVAVRVCGSILREAAMSDAAPIDRIRRRGARLAAFARYVVERFQRNGGTETAASLTYTTLFAVVPLMTVTYSLLSALPAFSGVNEAIQNFVFDNFLPATGEIVQDKLGEFSSQARQLTAVGTVFLVVTAYMMLVSIEKAFNRIWAVREPRRGMSKFLLYWGILTLSPLLIGVGFAMSSYLFSLPLIGAADVLGLRETLLRLGPLALSAGAFTVLYSAVPNTRVPLRHAVIGGFFTMLAFEGAKWGFALVMRQTAVEVIYGTFAAVPLFLIWIFLSWTIVLVGAEAVHALGVRRFDLVDERAGALVVALQFLHRVHRQHRAGGGLPDVMAMPVLQRLGPDVLPEVLAALERADVVRRDVEGNWLPGRDFAVIRVSDVLRALPGYLLDAPRGGSDEGPWIEALFARLGRIRDVREEALGVTLEELFAHDDTARAPDADQEESPDENIAALDDSGTRGGARRRA
jgi:membrane protein